MDIIWERSEIECRFILRVFKMNGLYLANEVLFKWSASPRDVSMLKKKLSIAYFEVGAHEKGAGADI